MSGNLPNQLIQKVIFERKKRGLTISVLARQSRLRQEFLHDLELKNDNSDFTISELRQIAKLAEFLKIDFNQKKWSDFTLSFKNTQQELTAIKEISRGYRFSNFVVFTSNNFNIILLFLVSVSVLFLVGLPAFLVVRPAEIFWNGDIQNQTILIKTSRRFVTGFTARAKNMTFGGQEILLKNGAFELDLPKPDQPVAVPLVLRNYFNLITEYQIVLKSN